MNTLLSNLPPHLRPRPLAFRACPPLFLLLALLITGTLSAQFDHLTSPQADAAIYIRQVNSATGRYGENAFAKEAALLQSVYRYDKSGRLKERNEYLAGELEIARFIYQYGDDGRLVFVDGRESFTITYSTKGDTLFAAPASGKPRLSFVDGVRTDASGKEPDAAATPPILKRGTPENPELLFDPAAAEYNHITHTYISHKELENGQKITAPEQITGSFRTADGTFTLIVTDIGVVKDGPFSATGQHAVYRYTDPDKPLAYDEGTVSSRGDQLCINGSGFNNKRCFVATKIGKRLLLQSGEGIYLLEPSSAFATALFQPSYPKYLPAGYGFVAKGNYEGLVDPTGKEIIAPAYRISRFLTPETILVKLGDSKERGIMNVRGETVVPLGRSYFEQRLDGIMIVRGEAGQGVYNVAGNWVVPVGTDYLEVDPVEGLLIVRNDGLFSILHPDGQVVTAGKKITKAYLLAGGGAAVHQTNGKIEVFGRNGAKIVVFAKGYTAVNLLRYDRYAAKRIDGRYDLLDAAGKTLLTFASDVPGGHDDGVLVYYQNGKAGLISLDDPSLGPAAFDNIEVVSQRPPVKTRRGKTPPKLPVYEYTLSGRKGELDHLGNIKH